MISAFYNRQYIDVGGLFSYGVSFTETFRRAAYYVDRLAKGKSSASCRSKATKYELVINLKTAKALGITMPTSLLLLASEVVIQEGRYLLQRTLSPIGPHDDGIAFPSGGCRKRRIADTRRLEAIADRDAHDPVSDVSRAADSQSAFLSLLQPHFPPD